MRQPHHHRTRGSSRAGRWAAGRWAALVAAVVVTTSGCTTNQMRGWLPGTDQTTTTNRDTRDLWVGSWVAGLAVGVLVWGLTIWCVVRYRRRRTDTGLPPQLRYNVPLEILYTLVPLFMIGVLFFYTARDQANVERRYTKPNVVVQVVGKRWSWDFNYLTAAGKPDVYDTGVQAQESADGVQENGLPTLWLPVGEKVELRLNSRDVNHSFWIPAFDYKKDVIPGRTNYMSVTPMRTGTYIGRCAELCGEYHALMLFKVHVVSASAYQDHLADLRSAQQTGSLPATLGPDRPNTKLPETPDQRAVESENA